MKQPLCWDSGGWKVRVLYSRAGVATSILVAVESEYSLLLDCGDGCLRDLLEKGVELNTIKAVFLSHGHFDHVGGLHSLLGFMRMVGRTEDLLVIAPQGAREHHLILDAFESACTGSLPFRIMRREVSNDDRLEICGISLTAFRVVHSGSTSKGIGAELAAAGCELTFMNQRVVYTGDTGLASSLESRIEGADLAIIEATLRESGGEMEQRVHLSLESAKALASKARRAFIIHRTAGLEPIEYCPQKS